MSDPLAPVDATSLNTLKSYQQHLLDSGQFEAAACLEYPLRDLARISPQARDLKIKARDSLVLGKPGSTKAKGKGRKVADEPSTESPSDCAGHSREQTVGTYHVANASNTVVHVPSKSDPKKTVAIKGKRLASAIENENELRQRIVAAHPGVRFVDGQLLVPDTATHAGALQAGAGVPTRSRGGSPGAAMSDNLSRWGWALPATGFLAGGVGGALAGGAIGRTTSGALGGAGMGVLAGVGTAASIAGFDGMAFKMRSIMKSVAADYKDDAMIAMINNQGIPIENLIFIFMAHMADKYEDKLREKMEETAMQEKMERKRQRREDMFGALGGIAQAVGGPTGTLISGAMKVGVAQYNNFESAMNGEAKSTTILMSEVQMLMQQWKQMNEMMSNILKSLHDMAMTPIRNIR